MATGVITGYNIAEGSMAGFLSIEKGTGQSIMTSNSNFPYIKDLTLNGYNLLTTQLQMSQSMSISSVIKTT
jgi:hypothetical protein